MLPIHLICLNNLLLRWHKFLELRQDIFHRKSICFPWEYWQRLISSPFLLEENMCCINLIFNSWILGANNFNLAPAAFRPVTLAWPCPSGCSSDCMCWGWGHTGNSPLHVSSTTAWVLQHSSRRPIPGTHISVLCLMHLCLFMVD